mgnify:CR=1 FL=1
MIYILFAVYVILSSSGMLLFKYGCNSDLLFSIGSFGMKFSINWIAVTGILCYGLSFILWLYIISQTKITVALPLSVGLINTVVYIISAIIFKEAISIWQIVGVFLVVTGIAFIGIQGGK